MQETLLGAWDLQFKNAKSEEVPRIWGEGDKGI